MNLMDSNNCPVTRLDNTYYPDPSYDKRYGVSFEISFNETYRGVYDVAGSLKFIEDFLITENPAPGVYHIKEVSPAKPSGEAIDMLDIAIENQSTGITVTIYERKMSTRIVYIKLSFDNKSGITQSGVNYILGFIQGWGAGVAANSSRF